MSFFKKASFLVKKEGIVNLKTGTSFRGVILEDDGSYVVMVNAQILQKTEGHLKPILVDGQVVIPKDEIEFVQVV